jgi:hypothetical protein
MDQAVSRWPPATEAHVKLQARPCEVCGGQSGTGMVSSPSMWVVPRQYHCTNDLYAFIRLSLTLLNLSS